MCLAMELRSSLSNGPAHSRSYPLLLLTAFWPWWRQESGSAVRRRRIHVQASDLWHNRM